jgi:hypothetical protein
MKKEDNFILETSLEPEDTFYFKEEVKKKEKKKKKKNKKENILEENYEI